MKKMLLIVNPRSGKCKAEKHLDQILAIFHDAGYQVTVHKTTGQGDGARAAEEYSAGMDAVVCCGGDGTFNETVNGLMRCNVDIPIGYIPAGSTNDFAASLQLPTDLLRAAKAIAEGKPECYDIGKINADYFSYVASFGAFTRTSYATSQNLKNRLGFLAYLLGSVKEVFRLRSVQVCAKLDDETIEGKFLFGAVSNSTRMGGIFRLDPARVDMADGKLEMMLIRPSKNPFALLGCLWALKKHRYDHPMIVFRSITKVQFTCPAGMVWTLDGERYEASQTLQIENQHHAIALIKKG